MYLGGVFVFFKRGSSYVQVTWKQSYCVLDFKGIPI